MILSSCSYLTTWVALIKANLLSNLKTFGYSEHHVVNKSINLCHILFYFRLFPFTKATNTKTTSDAKFDHILLSLNSHTRLMDVFKKIRL